MATRVRHLFLSGIASILAVTACAFADDKPATGKEGTKVVPLMSQVFADIPGKEGIMLTVEYAPGASTPIHRHNAHVFVYVLEGAIVMQVEGGQPVTLEAGQTFYEKPSDVHAVSRNASKTEKARFLVFMVKDQGAAPVSPAK